MCYVHYYTAYVFYLLFTYKMYTIMNDFYRDPILLNIICSLYFHPETDFSGLLLYANVLGIDTGA